MHITMIAVISEDGFLTRGNDPNPGAWASVEDQMHYQKILHDFPVLIIGNTTYSMAKKSLPDKAIKVVLSKIHQSTTEERVQFMNDPPRVIIEKLSQQHDRALLIGGGYTYTSFLEAGVVDTVLVTVEPLQHKTGVRLVVSVTDFETMYAMKLVSKTELNSRGTTLYAYSKIATAKAR